MNTWKSFFTESVLERSEKFNGKICDVKHDNSKISAVLKGRGEFSVELVIEEDVLFDMSCSCSSKSNCVHEAAFLRFINEFPEILEDHNKFFDRKKISAEC